MESDLCSDWQGIIRKVSVLLRKEKLYRNARAELGWRWSNGCARTQKEENRHIRKLQSSSKIGLTRGKRFYLEKQYKNASDARGKIGSWRWCQYNPGYVLSAFEFIALLSTSYSWSGVRRADSEVWPGSATIGRVVDHRDVPRMAHMPRILLTWQRRGCHLWDHPDRPLLNSV